MTTGAVSGSVPNGITLAGTLDNDGGKATQTKFEYGLTGAYGSSTPLVTTAVGAITPVTLSDLTPGVTYHYRAVGVNADGTGNGLDATFVLFTRTGIPEVYLGLSTDTKPTGVAIGSKCFETNTGDWYITKDGTNWVLDKGEFYA
jgi:hypothetical protein